MKLHSLLCLLIVTSVAAGHAATPAWPAFRGPNSSGVSLDATPPVNVGPTNGVMWKIQVPWSPSSPCAWDDKLFLTTFADNELQTRCYLRKDGKLAVVSRREAREAGNVS
jgi:hypothetical protein